MNRFLERLELRANRAYWSDGLLDLFSGIGVLTIGVSWVADQVVFGAILPALLVPLWKPVRERFTQPRLGMVELAEPRQRRNRTFIALMLLAGTLSFLLGVGVYLAYAYELQLSILIVKALPGLIIGIAAIATAEALQLRRFFVYGAITLLGALAVAMVSQLNPGWAFVAGGLAALIGGTVLACRFARAHSIRNGETSV